MSYILDALRRAERERRAGRTSALEQVAAASPEPAPSRRPLLAWGGGGVLVVLVVLGSALWWHERHAPSPPQLTPAETPAPATAESIPTPSAGAIAAAAAPAHSQAPLTRAGPVVIADAGHISSLDDVVPRPRPAPAARKPAETAPGAATDQVVDTGNNPPGAARQSTAPAPASGFNAAPGAAARTGPPEATPAVPGSHGGASAPAAKTVSPQSGLQALQQMPERYRANFPSFTVEVHVYDPDPGKRWVLIDGHRYTQGSSLPSGPKIYRIVPEGIVFDWQGQRVLYALNR